MFSYTFIVCSTHLSDMKFYVRTSPLILYKHSNYWLSMIAPLPARPSATVSAKTVHVPEQIFAN